MQADYVIVGAGSAGCAMAYRLSEAGRSVIVIEHGGTDAGPLIQMPAALSYPMNMTRYDWGYMTEPEPYLGGRRLVAPRGKVIGGSSSINVWGSTEARKWTLMSGLKKVTQVGPTMTFYRILKDLRAINLTIISPIVVPMVK